MENLDVALIQEPWVHNGHILGLRNSGTVFYDNTSELPRACVLIRKGILALPLSIYQSRDTAAVKISSSLTDDITVMSAYFPYDGKHPPPREVTNLVNHCEGQGKKLIIGCDANAHHVVWGSSDCNKRGEEVLEYLVSTRLHILNVNNVPTFVTSNRSEVIDLTLCTENIYNSVTKWHVSDEPSLSDHRHICFMVSTTPEKVNSQTRNPRTTNWAGYREDLGLQLRGYSSKLSSVLEFEMDVDFVQQSIINSYHQNCPVKTTNQPRLVPWWNNELGRLRKQTRKLFNRAKRTGDWSEYKTTLTSYHKAIREAKRDSWREFCGSISDIPSTAKLMKIMAHDNTKHLDTIKLKDGKYSNSGKETLTYMLSVHFPDSKVIHDNDQTVLPPRFKKTNKENWAVANEIVTYSRVIWAINSFKPYKAPGPDGILPILLQEGIEILSPVLCRIFRACIALGHIPSSWKSSRVIFIPKPGKANYLEAKAFRPISLTSFLLKILEKLVDRHIREEVLSVTPLSEAQFAYQAGKSTETALHGITNCLERAIEFKEIALAIFLDIEGAFDKVSNAVILKAAKRFGINDTMCLWIKSMLTNRIVVASLLGDTVGVSTSRGCPQGGVLSPLLWCLVVDELLGRLRERGYRCFGYADDVAIIITGRFPGTITDLMRRVLLLVEGWCREVNLTVNPGKTVLVPFTRKRVQGMFNDISFFGTILEVSTEVKYLGVILDSKLTWKPHLDSRVKKAKMLFWRTRSTISKSWGLRPKVVYWLYTMVIRPMLSYAAMAWWPRVRIKAVQYQLRGLQRLACVGITGAMRSSPSASLEILLNLLPLHLFIEEAAIMGAYRLNQNGFWRATNWAGSHTKLFCQVSRQLPICSMGSDKMVLRYQFDKSFSVHFSSRTEWTEDTVLGTKGELIWFTDGSKTHSGTGAGMFCQNDKFGFRESLGTYASVFQAEISAISFCVDICLKKHYRGRVIQIYSDSQAALKALNQCGISSKLVYSCVKLLNELGAHNKVQLYWVPGHGGVIGNEKADILAGEAASQGFCGPEPAIPVPSGSVRNFLRKYLSDRQLELWLKTDDQRQAKEFNSGPTKWRAKDLLSLSKTGIKLVTGLLTGHCQLNRHLHLMEISEDPMCRACLTEEETASHVLCSCVNYTAQRLVHLGAHILEPKEFSKIPAKRILHFVAEIGLFKS